jgi:hypothetical protein
MVESLVTSDGEFDSVVKDTLELPERPGDTNVAVEDPDIATVVVAVKSGAGGRLEDVVLPASEVVIDGTSRPSDLRHFFMFFMNDVRAERCAVLIVRVCTHQ